MLSFALFLGVGCSAWSKTKGKNVVCITTAASSTRTPTRRGVCSLNILNAFNIKPASQPVLSVTKLPGSWKPDTWLFGREYFCGVSIFVSFLETLFKVMNVCKLGPFCVNWATELSRHRGVNGCERCHLMWAVARHFGTWDPISSLSKDIEEYKMQMGDFIFLVSLFFWNQSTKKKFCLEVLPHTCFSPEVLKFS